MRQITGFAQKRRRTFIYAAKNTTTYYKTIKDKKFEDIIHKDGFFIKEFKIQDNTQGIIQKFEYKDICLAALLSSVSDIVNTVGKQFAQPLKMRDSQGNLKAGLIKKIQKDRSVDVLTI